MIAVLLMFFATATLVSTVPYWLGRSQVRYRTWELRDRIFDDLAARDDAPDVLWGLVERCEIQIRLSKILNPLAIAIVASGDRSTPASSLAFPDPEDIMMLSHRDRTFYDRGLREIDRLLVRQLVLTTWHGLILGSIAYLAIFLRSGSALDAVGTVVREKSHGRPEKVMACAA